MVIQGNVECAYPGCKNPVIAQCPGYPKGSGCGRFYCREHVYKDLCLKHGEMLMQDEVYDDYLSNSKRIRKESESEFRRDPITIITLLGLFFGLYLAISRSSYTWTTWGAFIIIMLVSFAAFIRLNNRQEKKSRALADEKPGFYEFYKAWRKSHDKTVLYKTLTIAGGVTLLGMLLAGGISSGIQNQQARNDLRAIRQKIDRM